MISLEITYENERDISKMESIYLKVSIIEPILISCINEASLSDIYSYLHKVTPNITENDSKEHLFYLINGYFIEYNGSNKKYIISQDRFELLGVIYSQRNGRDMDYSNLTVRVA